MTAVGLEEIIRLLAAAGLAHVTALMVSLGLLLGAVIDGRGVARHRAVVPACIALVALAWFIAWAVRVAVPWPSGVAAWQVAFYIGVGMALVLGAAIWLGSMLFGWATREQRAERRRFEDVLTAILTDPERANGEALRQLIASTIANPAAAEAAPPRSH